MEDYWIWITVLASIISAIFLVGIIVMIIKFVRAHQEEKFFENLNNPIDTWSEESMYTKMQKQKNLESKESEPEEIDESEIPDHYDSPEEFYNKVAQDIEQLKKMNKDD